MRIRQDGYVACMRGDERCVQWFGGKPKGKSHLEDLGMDGKIILTAS